MSAITNLSHNHVVIEGNIGSGKTTLARILSERWGSRLMLEQFSDNPFLPKFYENPQQYAFALELSFLAERYNQNRNELNQTDMFRPGIVADYSFAKSLIFARINLPEDEFQLYRSLFDIIHGRLPKPDLLVYLHCSEVKAMRQIRKRGRGFEQKIDQGYLEQITRGYLDFFNQQKEMSILIVNTDNIDFVTSKIDLHALVSVVERDWPIGLHRLVL